MPHKTSYDELYTTLGAVVQAATGRPWWRKAGIQAQPQGPYATVYLVEGVGMENPVVESVELDPVGDNGETFRQTPWNTTYQDVTVEFFRSASGDTALEAATRFRTALRLEERFWDLWNICGLVGSVRVLDISAIFRADIEPRAQVRFTIYANIADPAPLADDNIFDMQSQEVDVIHVRQDGQETTIPITVSGNVWMIGDEVVYGPDSKPVLVPVGA